MIRKVALMILLAACLSLSIASGCGVTADEPLACRCGGPCPSPTPSVSRYPLPHNFPTETETPTPTPENTPENEEVEAFAPTQDPEDGIGDCE